MGSCSINQGRQPCLPGAVESVGDLPIPVLAPSFALPHGSHQLRSRSDISWVVVSNHAETLTLETQSENQIL